MPFSRTRSCSEDQWTWIFENLIKPAVEDSGLDYTCTRSRATRGNLLKDIIVDLYNSDVVIADLTDRVSNVFYELGVRHALQNKTIMLVQNRKHAPFDLHQYASHVYNWKTTTGRNNLKKKIRELLIDIENNPEKPDSPVADFLQDKAVHRGSPRQEMMTVIEYDDQNTPHIVISPQKLSLSNVIGLILYAYIDKGLTMSELVRAVTANWKRVSSPRISATLSTMRELVIREGKAGAYVYRLSGKGRTSIRRLIQTLSTKD